MENMNNGIPTNVCPACGARDFYLQPDFRRSVGLWIVGVASVLTIVFAAMKMDWLTTWSPFVGVLVIDFVLYRISPPVLSCYLCEHRFRGMPKEKLSAYGAFDLDVHDRIHYAERTAPEER